MNPILSFLLQRAKEPSTYAGLGAVLGAVGLHFSPAQLDGLSALLMAIAGFAATFLPERAAKNLVVPGSLLGLALGLSACPQQQPQPDPKVVAEIGALCLGSGLFEMADTAAASFVPVPGVGLGVELLNAGVDKVCAEPEAFAGDVSTIEWLIRNLPGARSALWPQNGAFVTAAGE